MCLACHDGQIAKGQMMAGRFLGEGHQPSARGRIWPRQSRRCSATTAATATPPVTATITRWAPRATLGALRLVSSHAKATDPLTVVVSDGAISSITPTVGSTYANFAANYGYPAIAGSAWYWGVSYARRRHQSCQCIHDLHHLPQPARDVRLQGPAQASRRAAPSLAEPIPTYFFINAPYNPGAGNGNPTMAASTTQFCRQCHIGEAERSSWRKQRANAVLIRVTAGERDVSLPRFFKPERRKENEIPTQAHK